MPWVETVEDKGRTGAVAFERAGRRGFVYTALHQGLCLCEGIGIKGPVMVAEVMAGLFNENKISRKLSGISTASTNGGLSLEKPWLLTYLSMMLQALTKRLHAL